MVLGDGQPRQISNVCALKVRQFSYSEELSMYFLDNNTSVSIESGVRQSVSGSVSLSSAGLGGRTPSCQGTSIFLSKAQAVQVEMTGLLMPAVNSRHLSVPQNIIC